MGVGVFRWTSTGRYPRVPEEWGHVLGVRRRLRKMGLHQSFPHGKTHEINTWKCHTCVVKHLWSV